MNKTKKGIVVCLLTAALLVSMVGTASANPATSWDFGNNSVMYKNVVAPPPAYQGGLPIAAGTSKIVKAENAAQLDGGVSFTAQYWNGQVECSSPTATKKFTVEIGICDGSSFTSKGKSDEKTLDHSSGLGRTYELLGAAFTVPKDQWLAVRINSTGSADFTMVCDGSSFTDYPPDSEYPIPELSTLLLMSTGLLTLAGFVVYSRRRNNK